MRNLKLNNCRCWKNVDGLATSSCLSIDFDTGAIFGAGAHRLTAVDHQTGQTLQTVCLNQDGHMSCEEHIVSIQYLMEHQAVVAATSGGSLVMWHYHTNHVEVVGCVDNGVRAMSWSPDQELLILATGAHSLIMMSREFDPITEVGVPSEESVQEKFVNVGWGKRETQFQGQAGKAAAYSKIEMVETVTQSDDRRSRISWRGDGQMFAVTSINVKTDSRQLSVWSREGVLQNVSEMVNGLEHTLSWKPSGSLIASTQQADGHHDVVFFEKNGLRHGQFTLPFLADEVMIREISWNVDSTVLAVWCDRTSPVDGHTPVSYILLYAVNNYHWYLKQTLSQSSIDQSVTAFCWHPEHVYTMHVVCKSGTLLEYTWSWSTNRSRGTVVNDLANVAVIDGANVLVTPFRTTVIPPPYCAYKVRAPSPVNQLTFGPLSRVNDFALLTHDHSLLIYSFDPSEKSPSESVDPSIELESVGGEGFTVTCQTPKLTHSLHLGFDSTNDLALLSHLTWLNEDTFIVLGPSDDSRDTKLYELQLTHTDTVVDILIKRTAVIAGRVCNVCVPDDATLVLHTSDGALRRYTPATGRLDAWTSAGLVVSIPQMCSTLAVCTVGDQDAVIGLTERFRLYVNGIEIASNCTSFAVHTEYILLTTLSHTCRCISRRTSIPDLATLSDSKKHPFDESVRRIERGSRVVAAVTGDTKLVLQMPRGNLETIHPRALVLSAVRSYLDGLSFSEAFSMMRKHRINLNLFHDHDPATFLSHLTQFVNQLSDVSHINLFLSELSEGDVTVTMYTGAYVGRTGGGEAGKVDRICDAVRQTVTEMDPQKYLLSIITSHVRKTVPELEAVLGIIKALPVSCETCGVNRGEALTYALFLVDVNKLYNVALGMYDFDLVLLVAERSQKDPKEYLPYLNDLRRLERNYQRFTIDKFLKNHTKALSHIAQCEDKFSECLAYINDHSLYAPALSLFTRDTPQYQEIAGCYGDRLSTDHKYDESGVMFVKARDWERALRSFERGGNWRQAVCMSSRLEQTLSEKLQLATRLAKYLREHQRYSEAGIMYEQYLRDIEEAIAVLIEGCLWDEALTLMYRYERLDFIDTHLKPHLTDTCSAHLSSIRTMTDDFIKYRDRLAVVRREKEKLHSDLFDAGGETQRGVDVDLYSDAASAMGDSVVSSTVSSQSQRSTSSKTSGRSSRNRRKAERKKWRVKEGSLHEDTALMEGLSKIVSYLTGVTGEIHSLLLTMSSNDHDEEARQLQTALRDSLELMQRSRAEIWPPNKSPETISAVLGPQSTAESLVQARQDTRQDTRQINHVDSSIDAALSQAPVISFRPWSLSILDTKT